MLTRFFLWRLAQSEIVNGDNGLSLQLTGNKRDDKQRYYDRFYNDPITIGIGPGSSTVRIWPLTPLVSAHADPVLSLLPARTFPGNI